MKELTLCLKVSDQNEDGLSRLWTGARRQCGYVLIYLATSLLFCKCIYLCFVL